MPPPLSAELLLRVLLLIVSIALLRSAPKLQMPPPEEVAELLLKVLLLMATVALPGPPENPGEAWFQMPPPVPLMPAELPFTVLVLTVRAALPANVPSLRMPPPVAP